MEKIYLIIGGNMGNREKFLSHAKKEINQLIGKINLSSFIYETEAWGYLDNKPYLNQVLEIETILSPNDILNFIIQIENKLGRIRTDERYSSRTIDIDILFYGNLILNSEKLIIPHPRICERRFVLTPLVEIIPDFIHPIEIKTVEKLLKECNDNSNVTIYK